MPMQEPREGMHVMLNGMKHPANVTVLLPETGSLLR
jgi:hypothetical protein